MNDDVQNLTMVATHASYENCKPLTQEFIVSVALLNACGDLGGGGGLQSVLSKAKKTSIPTKYARCFLPIRVVFQVTSK
jgi:hypothetical protein